MAGNISRDNNNSSSQLTNAEQKLQEIQELENKLVSLKQDMLVQGAINEDDEIEELNFLLIKVGTKTFAAPIRHIDEVIEMPAVEPLPKEMNAISGLVNYHGDYLAVIDIGELVGMGRTNISPNQSLVVCTVEPRRFALKVDETMEVVAASPKDITISEKVLPGILKNSGVLRLNDQQVALIVDISWIAVGAQLANLLCDDAATPIDKDKS